MYDYLIVGSGLFGAVVAYQLTQAGKSCLVIDKRSHIGGNIYTENENGITVHKYGAHIFHTNNEAVWSFITQFSKFNNFINSPIAIYHDEIYNLPFNMNTFSKMWNIVSPAEAMQIINAQRAMCLSQPTNLEEQAISLVGKDIYSKLIKEYTEKQWGRKCKDLPASIIKRIPIRFTYDNNYFNALYQGIPVNGYTDIVSQLLKDCDVKLNTSYKTLDANIANFTVYTGSIDEFFDFSLGHLDYRSVEFKNEILNIDNFQGNAVVNYTSHDVPYTRIIEHKHFTNTSSPHTIISKEYPIEWQPGIEPFYPINDDKNMRLYYKYKKMADKLNNVIFCGRLGEYAYYDMDKTIENALHLSAKLNNPVTEVTMTERNKYEN